MKIVLLFAIRIYKNYLSPLLKNLFGHWCRFTPTCSQYSYEAIEKYGVQKGLLLSLKRIVRCNPFVNPGYDPLVKLS